MKINRLTLQFPPKLEKDFRDYFYPKSLKQGRIAIVSAVFLYLIWGIADIFLAPEVILKQILTIRYGIILPLFMGIFVWSFQKGFKKKYSMVLEFCYFSNLS